MTIAEPAGAGTAEEIGMQIALDTFATPSFDDGSNIERLAKAVTAAITAAESRAMERCAKIAESYAHIREGSNTSVAGDPSPMFADGWDACAKAIGAALSPPSHRETTNRKQEK